jgi:tetratricopeptide (TPR) repeat protein
MAVKRLHYLSLWATSLTIPLSLGIVSPVTLGLSSPEVWIAQSAANYENAMRSGYEAAGKEDFKNALKYFRRALKLRPGDANAQLAIANINQNLKEGNSYHVTPSGVGAPSERERGATRQKNCLNGSKLIAIIPENQLGLTSLAKPTLFFYIPPTLAKSLQVRFEDEKTADKFYDRTVTTPAKSGLAKFDLAELNDAPSLESDKTYRWTLTLHCDPQDRSADVSIFGTIRRIAIDPILLRQLEKVGIGDRARLYAINRLWYDTVKTIAEARQSNPQDAQLNNDWVELLRSVGLDAKFGEAIDGD